MKINSQESDPSNAEKRKKSATKNLSKLLKINKKKLTCSTSKSLNFKNKLKNLNL